MFIQVNVSQNFWVGCSPYGTEASAWERYIKKKVADSVEQAGAGVAKLLFSIQFRSVTAQRTTVL